MTSDDNNPLDEITEAEELSAQTLPPEVEAPEAPGSSAEFEVELTDEQRRAQLVSELDILVDRMKETVPEYSPPPFSKSRLRELIGENLGRRPSETVLGILERFRSAVGEDLFDVDTWKGVWYMVNFTLDYQAGRIKRRMSGDYETDEWGFDPEILDVVKPFVDFMYYKYWRVEAIGLENIPDDGRALLVCNHSGQIPWDAMMLGAAVLNEHPTQRLVRGLYATLIPIFPFFSDLVTKLGQVLANEENGLRLLEQEELVSVFPEGYKGISKLFKNRYRLARFGRGGFVRMAIKTGTPMIPVSIVGAEETYISLAKSPSIAKMINLPYFPITPTFPWLGLLGFIPLPTKWSIEFGEPISLDEYQPEDANNLILVSQLTDQVRNIIQSMIYQRLAERRSIFVS